MPDHRLKPHEINHQGAIQRFFSSVSELGRFQLNVEGTPTTRSSLMPTIVVVGVRDNCMTLDLF